MHCPVCKSSTLRSDSLDDGLPAYFCDTCGGIWIGFPQYWRWAQQQDAIFPNPLGDVPIPVETACRAKLCPDCGHILTRYQVWPAVKFYLDRCGHCRGIWFDKDEWTALRARRMHTRIHEFFTPDWQEDLRDEEARQRFAQIYQERFGAEDYAEIKRLKAWLAQHPNGPALLAYLNDPDPYRVLFRKGYLERRGERIE